MEDREEGGGAQQRQMGTHPALKARAASCFVTIHGVRAAVKIQRSRSGYRRPDSWVRVCVLWFISTLQQSFGNYAQGFTHGGSGSGARQGRGAAGISWALHFEAVEGSLGRKPQSEQPAEADNLSRRFTWNCTCGTHSTAHLQAVIYIP